MSSHICDTCLKVLSNYINWCLGVEKLDKSLRKQCTLNAYPYKSCREHIALNVIQDEFVRYLENKVNHSQLDRSKREDSPKCEMRYSEHCGNTVREVQQASSPERVSKRKLK